MNITRRDAQEGADLGIEALYRRWVALRDDINTTKGRSDEETEPLSEAQISVERMIAETPAQSLRGVLVKLRLHILEYVEEPKTGQTSDDLVGLDRIQVPSALADLERLAGVAVVSSDPPLMDLILDLEPALIELRGASDIFLDVVPTENKGLAWLSEQIASSVRRLHEQFNALHLAAGGSS